MFSADEEETKSCHWYSSQGCSARYMISLLSSLEGMIVVRISVEGEAMGEEAIPLVITKAVRELDADLIA